QHDFWHMPDLLSKRQLNAGLSPGDCLPGSPSQGVHVSMNRNILSGALMAALAMTVGANAMAAGGTEKERVWIKFKPGAKAQVENTLRSNGGQIHHSFDGLNAVAVSLPVQALNGIRNNPNV